MTPATGAAVFAVDPVGLGGVVLRAASAQAREDWLAALRGLLAPGGPLRRVPLHIDDAALLGGLDLGATLQAGRPVVRPGLLAQADGSVLVLPMAERASPALAARIAAVLDSGEVVLQRDGVALSRPARIGLVVYDEAREADESVPAALADRLALHLDLGAGDALHGLPWPDRAEIEAAQLRLPRVTCGDAILQALCAAAQALGVGSLRAPLLAVRVARVLAALDGAGEVTAEHASAAARLVLGPRATRAPAGDSEEAAAGDDASQEPQEASAPPDPPPPGEGPQPAGDATADDRTSRAPDPQDLADAVLAVAGGCPRGPRTEDQPRRRGR
ncbi:MAG: magnesium chelatase ATPase subunit D, partial [Comamonadaceae bacterium]